jgi:stage III sporulation protein AA
MTQAKAWEGVAGFFPPNIRTILAKIPEEAQSRVLEVRLRVNQPVELVFDDSSAWLRPDGRLTPRVQSAYRLGPADLKAVMNSFTAGSFYALEETIAQGYIALPGGHRVGIAGFTLCEAGRVRLIRNISGLNFRIARSVRGIARPLLPFLWEKGRFLKTLLFSPPAAGKTTLLREIVRMVSDGVPELNIPGIRVGLADERSEIAGCFLGEPQLDVGSRTDVLDGCPKREGVYLLLRAMNPQLIATDEIGAGGDLQIIEDIINTGVSLLATAHAHNLREAMGRPGMKQILDTGMVERLVCLSNRMGVGTVESIKAGVAGPELLSGPFRPEADHD